MKFIIMARTKKQIKAKEPVRIRFKELANGNKSIYLDCYKDGKRSYEFLHLYLIPEMDAASKTANANTMDAATVIKGERIKAIVNGEAGIKDFSAKAKILVLDWCDEYKKIQERKRVHTPMSIDELKRMLAEYHKVSRRGDKVMMRDVDKDYCLQFIDFLRNTHVSPRTHQHLKPVTAYNYCTCITCVLNAAVRRGVIASNPFYLVEQSERIKAPDSQRAYLTKDEVKKLIQTPCTHDIVKRAYLFACYCGLRISDVEALTWDKLEKDGEQWHLSLTMKKTQEPLYLPLNKQALKWMPDRNNAKPTERIFAELPCSAYVNILLLQWAKDAGITKHITFHTARHTFATLSLKLGADLYTVSKLLGHSDVKVTEVYAKIVDEEKNQAVNNFDNEDWE